MITEYSKNNMQSSLGKVQKINDFTKKTFELINGIQVFLDVNYNSSGGWDGRIHTSNPGITEENLISVIGELSWQLGSGEKVVFLKETDEKVKKLITYLVKFGLKTEEDFGFDDDEFEEDSGISSGDDLTQEEKMTLGIQEEDELETAFDNEKQESMKNLGIKSTHVKNDIFNTSKGRYEVYLKSLTLFPLVDGIYLNIVPNLYVPHIYVVDAMIKDREIFYMYKGTVNAKTLGLIYKKAKALGVIEAKNDDGAYDLQDFLVKISKNPYFKMSAGIVKAVSKKQEKCQFCGSESIFEETYSGTIVTLEVGGGQSPAVSEPIEVSDFGDIEGVNCAACKRSLLTVPKFNAQKEDIENFFSDFECSVCGDNAFKSETRKKVKVKLDYAKFLRRYDPETKMSSMHKLKEIGGMKEIYCQNHGCNGANYI